MSLQVCVCPLGGAIPACIAGGIPACLAAGGSPPGGASGPGGAWSGGSPPGQSPWGGSPPGGCGLLLWPSVVAFWFCGLLLKVTFCYGLLLWSSVMVFWRGARKPHQKATTPEGHHRGGCLVETPRMATAAGGTHPTGTDSCRAWNEMKICPMSKSMNSIVRQEASKHLHLAVKKFGDFSVRCD